MTPTVRSISPTGRYQLLVTSWEARHSLWVDSPQVVEVASGQPLLRFSSDAWSVDADHWESASVVELLLRKYPGNHLPVQLRIRIDCESRVAAVEGGAPVRLDTAEAELERNLSWR